MFLANKYFRISFGVVEDEIDYSVELILIEFDPIPFEYEIICVYDDEKGHKIFHNVFQAAAIAPLCKAPL